GTLGIYAGCTQAVFDILRPVLLYMGCQVLHMGENGKGIQMKICQNALSHEIQAAVNETLTLAQLNGISVDNFAKAVSMGGAGNFYLQSKYEAIRDRDYSVAFPVEYALKDLNICK
ncbi:NAD-binding protein, partial [Parabacteroides distasonis]